MSKEHVFEYLRRKDSQECFEEGIVRNWYVARAYVQDRLKDIAISPDTQEYLQFVIPDDSPLMMAVLRQIALSAHYINYEEYDQLDRLSCKNRTVVTLVSQKREEDIIQELEKEENLCNLLQCCKYSVYGKTTNADSFIDIELNIVHQAPEDNDRTIRITENDVRQWAHSKAEEDIYSSDTRMAILASRAYQLGAVIDNLPAEDIHCAKRYSMALNTFQYVLLGKKITSLVDEEKWKKSLIVVKNGLSNVFCADCFESRERGIKAFAQKNGIPEKDAWEINNEALSCSEHNRWVVERLIMGFSPLSVSQRLQYDSLFGKRREEYAKLLKNQSEAPAHIDICSYRDLRRINPNDMKYDSFLMLAIPLILEKIRKDDRKKSS